MLATLLFPLVALALAGLSAAYEITIHNHCSYKIYPAASQHNFGGASDFPLLAKQYTGFPLSSGSKKTIQVPDQWTGGRIWARTGCNPEGQCAVGECSGGMECTDYNWTAKTSLAEFGYGGIYGNFYDISLVAGFNVGIEIKPALSSCLTRTCASENCPADQAYHQSSDTFVDTSCKVGTNFDVTFCP